MMDVNDDFVDAKGMQAREGDFEEVRPLISTSALGRESVSGRKRVPRPAARIMAFMGKPVASGEWRVASSETD